MEQKTDLRVIKTRRNIQQTFIFLLQQKNFERITVQNILDSALINRTTFYKHYEDKYDLADRMIEELLEKFKTEIEERFTVSVDGLSVTLVRFYESLLKDREHILALMNVHTEKHHLWEDYRNFLKDKYLRYMEMQPQSPTDLELSYKSELYASIAMTSVKWLLEQGDEAGIDIIVNRTVKKIGHLIDAVIHT